MQCWQILDRMINQNIFDDIAQDYRYYEDPSDEFRDEEGTLLPLWKFSYEKTKKMHITDMCFNTLYYDLFAVCYGSRTYHMSTKRDFFFNLIRAVATGGLSSTWNFQSTVCAFGNVSLLARALHFSRTMPLSSINLSSRFRLV